MKDFQNRFGGGAILGLALAAGMATAPAIATAASLEMGLQLRYRGEADMRDFNDDTGTDVVNSQRTRLSAKVDQDRYHAFLQIQDVRVWGEEQDGGDPTLTDVSADGLDMHQGFFKVDDLFGTGIGVQVGRQEVNLADQRLVGAVDWTQNARSFDGIILSRGFGDAGVVVPFIVQLREDDAAGKGTGLRQANAGISMDEGNDNDQWVAGIHSIWNVAEGQSFQPYVYFLRDGGPDLNLYTVGFYYDGKAGALTYDFTADWQTGDVNQADVDWNAYMVAGNIGFQSGPIMVGGGIDYLSGDDKVDDEIKSFTTLLATNHKFYGYMDYFNPNVLPMLGGADGLGGAQGLGLIDYHVKGWYTIDGPTKGGVDVHYFTTAEENKDVLHDSNGKSVDTYGTELDFGFKTKSGPLDIYAGYSVFFQDDAMEARFRDAGVTNNEDIAHWAFVMASIAFP